jgi:uncharacterized protein (DUF488 family)
LHSPPNLIQSLHGGRHTGFYTIYTIGHSDLTMAELVERLKARQITLVTDVRSYPYSSSADWFNRDRIENSLRKEGIEYLFVGSRLGGLTEDGRFDYIRREKNPAYQEGIKDLLGLAENYRIAVMSSEADYLHSHRHHLIAQTLLKLGVGVVHIDPSGDDAPAQADLFHAVMEEE